MSTLLVVRNAQGYAVASGPADGNYVPTIPAGYSVAVEENPDLTPPPLTPFEEEEIKRRLLAEAMVKRDTLLGHLRWFFQKAEREVWAAEAALAAAVGEPAQEAAQLVLDAANAKAAAIDTAVVSLEAIFNDQRVVDAVDGAVAGALKTVYLEIFAALYQSSQSTWLAMKALDPL